jgi:hypothetical protein
MKYLFSIIFFAASMAGMARIPSSAAPAGEFYEIRIYQVSGSAQEKLVDDYLQQAYLPALHRAGIAKVGVFKPVETDTAYFGKRIYVLIPFASLEEFAALPGVLLKDRAFQAAGQNYIDAPHTAPPYIRFESIILKAFRDMPKLEVPGHKTPFQERVYELRSYEGYTEKIYKNKEKMFNEGGEVGLFKRLGFNAVFYAEVLAGSRRPNLMYMTSFSNMASREEHWKTFVADPEWKKLSSMPEYQHNVSKINIYLLHPTSYSDI